MDCKTFDHIWATLDLKTAYWNLQLAEKLPPLYLSLPNDSSSDEEVLDLLKTTIEEKCYGTVPGSDTATIAALVHSKPQANPVVPRGKSSLKRMKKTATHPKMVLVPKTTTPTHPISSICTIL